MSNSEDNLYSRAGVADVRDFYRTKFVSDEVLDARYFKALDRLDIRFARTMWVYDNVRAGSAVLDLGCGAGTLALLKRKGVTLAGVDLSPVCALAARRNGYDFTCSAGLPRAFCLDRAAEFDDGWYEPNVLPPVARWMRRRGRVRFRAPSLSALR